MNQSLRAGERLDGEFFFFFHIFAFLNKYINIKCKYWFVAILKSFFSFVYDLLITVIILFDIIPKILTILSSWILFKHFHSKIVKECRWMLVWTIDFLERNGLEAMLWTTWRERQHLRRFYFLFSQMCKLLFQC